MQLTINSRILDKKLTFSCPYDAYIFVDLNGGYGVTGLQICRHGSLSGNTLKLPYVNSHIYDNSDELLIKEFKVICRNWYRNFIRKNRKYY